MKNRSHPIQIPQIKLLASIMAVLVIAMPCGIAAHAQTINFDVPGGSTAGVGGTSGSYVNYAGQGAYADLPGNTNWNPVTRNGTTSSGFLSDGVTASPITLTATVSGAYSGH